MYEMPRDEAFAKIESHWAKAGFEPLVDCGTHEIWVLDIERTDPDWKALLGDEP